MVRTSGSIASQRLGDVPDEKRFWCCDGRVFKNLSELGTALSDMSDDVFSYHCNESRKDFATWVRDVIGDSKLARDLSGSKSPSQAARRVADRIEWLQARIN